MAKFCFKCQLFDTHNPFLFSFVDLIFVLVSDIFWPMYGNIHKTKQNKKPQNNKLGVARLSMVYSSSGSHWTIL